MTIMIRKLTRKWLEINGSTNPQPFLDSNFCSFSFKTYRDGDATCQDIDDWCDNSLGNDNWYRMLNKYWFNHENDLALFKLTWMGTKFTWPETKRSWTRTNNDGDG